jgi:hypothetical protein
MSKPIKVSLDQVVLSLIVLCVSKWQAGLSSRKQFRMAATDWQIVTVNPRIVVDVLSALLTPMIGIATVYIAYQQWRTNKTRLDLERYDRRLAIYKAVDAFYGEIGTLGTAKYPMVFELRRATAEATFLFPREIDEHLAALYEKGMRVAALREQTYPSSGEPGLPVRRSSQQSC